MTENISKIDTVSALRQQVSIWRAHGHKIGLVPTMGSLHDGHLSLVDIALAHSDRVIVSIFINPTQFAPNEDFSGYPRDFAADAEKLQQRSAHLIYQPLASEMYNENEVTRVRVGKISDSLCGISRPHFFEGVATVVAKLLLQASPDIAVFGEKDYQQLLVVRSMVRDLSIPTKIIGAETIRETDGLAMSSRNAYLSASDRALAPQMFESMQTAAHQIAEGQNIAASLEGAKNMLAKQGFVVEYIELRDATTLDLIENTLEPGIQSRIFAAASLGNTRLIDNLEVSGS